MIWLALGLIAGFALGARCGRISIRIRTGGLEMSGPTDHPQLGDGGRFGVQMSEDERQQIIEAERSERSVDIDNW